MSVISTMKPFAAGTAAGLALAFSSSAATSSPNGLNQIPIAKVYGDGGIALSFGQTDLGENQSILTTQYGLYNIGEVGVDYQEYPDNEARFLGNGKVLLLHKPGWLPDVAAGVEDVAHGLRAEPYVVATTQPKLWGFSIGETLPPAGGYEPMGGVSYNATATLQIVADAVAGSSNFSTIGVIDNITPEIQANIAYAQPNSAAAGGSGYIFNIAYIFHLKGGGISQWKDLSTKGGVIKTPGAPPTGASDKTGSPVAGGAK